MRFIYHSRYTSSICSSRSCSSNRLLRTTAFITKQCLKRTAQVDSRLLLTTLSTWSQRRSGFINQKAAVSTFVAVKATRIRWS